MTDTKHNYWLELLSSSFEECGVTATSNQLRAIAEDVMLGHDNYGMAFYSPPPSDRLQEIKLEYQKKQEKLQYEFDKYRENAEIAIKKALKQYNDANVSIEENGEVMRYDGRTTRIQ